jgi:hypothetical protein
MSISTDSCCQESQKVDNAAIVQLWCDMEQSVPEDFAQDIVELWQELYRCFSSTPLLLSRDGDEHAKKLQLALLQVLLGHSDVADLQQCACSYYH